MAPLARGDRSAALARSPRLVALAGPFEGEIFELGREAFTIGRQASSSLQLHHGSVSRRHCILERREGGVRLRDLESLCGTFVNGVPVRERRLEHGDYIKVGDSLFLFLSREGDVEAVVAAPHEGSDPETGSTVELPLDETFYRHPERLLTSPQHGERNARHLATLLNVSAAVQAIRGVEPLARQLAELVFDVLPAERIAVLLADGDELSLAHATDRRGEQEIPQFSRTLAQRVLSKQVAVLSNDIAADAALAGVESLHATGARSLLCVPLVTADRSLGVLLADTSQQDACFDGGHLKLLSAVAGIVSPAVSNALRTEWLEAENRRLRGTGGLDHDIVGESPAIQSLLRLLSRVAPTDLTVLVLGESGTGKELVAKAIHHNSPRAEKPFVAINCATLSETLLESELFGHEKGSFTGAVSRKIGQLELAHEGTLFLDEVGEIPPPVQARLLRALENREFRRVGGTETIRIDVRVVAATHRDLETAIRDGTFREDLYHRLNVFALQVPPLRERREDIPLLARFFAARSARRLKRPVSGLSPESRAAIAAYDWPGNVRELKNVMERAVVLATEELLRPEDLPEAVLESAAGAAVTAGTYHEAVAEAKRRILLEAVREADGNYSEAARRLGLNRTYLHRLLNNLKLRPEIGKPPAGH